MLVFLWVNHQESYVNLTNQYAEFMCRRYYSELKTYSSETAKLVEEKISKNDVVVVDEVRHTEWAEFQLEEWEQILIDLDADPIVPHVASKRQLLHTLEEVFRS